jgi:hypothetical protein
VNLIGYNWFQWSIQFVNCGSAIPVYGQRKYPRDPARDMQERTVHGGLCSVFHEIILTAFHPHRAAHLSSAVGILTTLEDITYDGKKIFNLLFCFC